MGNSFLLSVCPSYLVSLLPLQPYPLPYLPSVHAFILALAFCLTVSLCCQSISVCMSFWLSVSFYVSVVPIFCLSVSLYHSVCFVRLSHSLFICPYLSVCLPLWLHICLSLSVNVCTYVCISVCLCVCLFTCFSVCLFMFMLAYQCFEINYLAKVLHILKNLTEQPQSFRHFTQAIGHTITVNQTIRSVSVRGNRQRGRQDECLPLLCASGVSCRAFKANWGCW